MTIQEFLTETSKRSIPLSDLVAIAADRAAFGDDVITGFRTQIELRSASAQKVLSDAEGANRDTLLASEQRAFDTANRERDSILSLQQAVERRTEQRAHVPATQTSTGSETRTDDTIGPVLTREQRCIDYVRQRGGRYVGERGADRMRFGSVVRGFLFGNRDGLSDLELRALSESVDASGGFTVPEILSGQFIDRVRNVAVVFRAGAATIPMTSDVLHIARLAQPGLTVDGSPDGMATAWKVEHADIAEGDLTLERVSFQARTLPILIKMSVELSEDSNNIDRIIETELARAFALELDRVALFGSGVAPEPRGIRNQANVNVEDFGGAAVSDFDFVIDSLARLWAANHAPNARIYPPALAAAFAKLKDSTGQPLRTPDVVTAVPAFTTNQIPNVGGSPTSTSMFIGDFSQLMIGMRTTFRLESSRVAGDAFTKLQIWIRGYLRCDVQLAHPEAFDVVEDIG